jgi:predicted SnoaL-like aldol condensation-catalyzing enzyme
VAIVAEGDLVVISFVRELPEPGNPSKKYTSTSFDMFRIENNRIVEHWDSALKQ